MPAPKKSKRPKARPTAPRKSKRPLARMQDHTPTAEAGDQVFIKDTTKMAKGGIVRGAGAATKGKKYTRCG